MKSHEQELLRRAVESVPFRPIFVIVSGAHLYGFPSSDSDYDLRGVFALPLRDVIGLDGVNETFDRSFDLDGCEMDLVMHDLKKFLLLLLNKNGYVLEQLYSPLVVYGGGYLDELRELAKGSITRHVYHHYQGFARGQIKRFELEEPRRIKTLLYIYRVLLTGIHLLETGEVEANLLHLNQRAKLSFIADLVDQKQQEGAALVGADLAMHQEVVAGLQAGLEEAFMSSTLPDSPGNRPALNEFLVRVRLEGVDE